MLISAIKSIRIFLAMLILTGIVYPLVVTGVGQVFFPVAAGGSLVERNGRVVGSTLIAQKTMSPRYFSGRPSASDFATLPSGASNAGPTSASLKSAVEDRKSALGGDAPVELLLASGSGLDPHISPKAAMFQVERVATARSLSPEARRSLQSLVENRVEAPTLGFLGRPRVNVLLLNLAVDERFP